MSQSCWWWWWWFVWIKRFTFFMQIVCRRRCHRPRRPRRHRRCCCRQPASTFKMDTSNACIQTSMKQPQIRNRVKTLLHQDLCSYAIGNMQLMQWQITASWIELQSSTPFHMNWLQPVHRKRYHTTAMVLVNCAFHRKAKRENETKKAYYNKIGVKIWLFFSRKLAIEMMMIWTHVILHFTFQCSKHAQNEGEKKKQIDVTWKIDIICLHIRQIQISQVTDNTPCKVHHIQWCQWFIKMKREAKKQKQKKNDPMTMTMRWCCCYWCCDWCWQNGDRIPSQIGWILKQC